MSEEAFGMERAMPAGTKSALMRDDMSVSPARLAKRIGIKLRDIYELPEAAPLPIEHVDLLLRLRHKERDLRRGKTAAE